MDDNELVQLVANQLCEAQIEGDQRDLELILDYSGQLIVQGTIYFCIEHKNHIVEDAYKVKIFIPSKYPNEPPIAKETGGAIPNDYKHKFIKSGYLCIGIPVEVKMVFAKHKSLLGFINALLIPSLFSYSYYRDYGEFPYGDRDHGIEGINDFYCEYFGTDTFAAIGLLKHLADSEFPQNQKCPCESGKDLCFCHGRKVLELWEHQSPDEFAFDLFQIILSYSFQLKFMTPLWLKLSNFMPKNWPNLIDMWSMYAKAG